MTAGEILAKGLKQLRDDVVARSEAAGQRATGRTYEQISTFVEGETHGELRGPGWVAVLEDGRKPGKVPFNFFEVIMAWAEAKGISWASADPVTFEKWAKGVAWHIRREGTRQYQSGQQLDIFKTPIADFEARLEEQVKIFYATRVAEQLRTAWQQ